MKKLTKSQKAELKQQLTTIASAAIATILLLCCSSCNVTRKVETKAQYYQCGDTTTTIVTKTTETYDASKNK